MQTISDHEHRPRRTRRYVGWRSACITNYVFFLFFFFLFSNIQTIFFFTGRMNLNPPNDEASKRCVLRLGDVFIQVCFFFQLPLFLYRMIFHWESDTCNPHTILYWKKIFFGFLSLGKKKALMKNHITRTCTNTYYVLRKLVEIKFVSMIRLWQKGLQRKSYDFIQWFRAVTKKLEKCS